MFPLVVSLALSAGAAAAGSTNTAAANAPALASPAKIPPAPELPQAAPAKTNAAAQAAPGPGTADPEAVARADYERAGNAVREAEAALIPLREAMQKADKAYADARKSADTKRQQATDSKNLAGEPGVKELQQAEAGLSAARKAFSDATNAKPSLDKEAADARAAALPLQQASDAVEKAAREAEAAAKAASDTAGRLDIEAKRAAAQAATLRRVADNAKAALARARQAEQNLQSQADAAPQKVAEAALQKKTADEALAKITNQVAAAASTYQAAEQAAMSAESNSRQAPEAKRQQAAAEGAAWRKAADAVKAALAQTQAAIQGPQNLVNAAAQKLARATAQKNLVEAQLAGARKQVAAAAAAAQSADQAAQAAGQAAEEKKQAAALAAAKRKAAADAPAALAQAQKSEQQAQAEAAAAAKKLAGAEAAKKSAEAALAKARDKVARAATNSLAAQKLAQGTAVDAGQTSADSAKPDAEKMKVAADAAAKAKAAGAALAQAQQEEKTMQAQAAAAGQKLAEAQAEKKSADQALAGARARVPIATSAVQTAQQAAREFLQLDETSQQAAAIAAAQRKVANEAKAALNPKAKAAEQAAIKANTAAQTLARAEARAKSAEEGLDSLKKRIAAAKQTWLADEEAAKQAEAAAVPLTAEAQKTRAAYVAAGNVADDKRAAAEQAKGVLYRLIAARNVAGLMESSLPPRPANAIDEIVFARLQALGIKPVLCSDAVFVRRACLDVTGTLPSAEEARAFIQNSDQNKRVALVDSLLDRSAHVDYWAMKWSDILRIKAEFPVKVWPNAAQAYHRWVWESIALNKPYDQFARELLTSSGSDFRVGPVNFYRAIQDKTPEGIASAVGLALMGTRVQLWPPDRRAAMGVFFSQVGYKPTSEWKEEIVFWDPLKSAAIPGCTAPGVDAVAKAVTETARIPQALAKPLDENGPLEAVFPDGTKTTVPPARDPREVFADWLIRPGNPWFARAVVNRTWAWIMGRGIIHEPDDIRDENPPSNPELLARLEKEFVASGYNLKHLRRLIFTSTTYQLSPIPKSDRPEARASFASYLMRRVDAEVLNDILNDITGSTDLYTSAVPEPFTYIPRDMNAVEVADGSITSSFLTLFGRSARATGMESERVSELASPQWLYMLNSVQMQKKLQGGSRLTAMLASGGKPNEIAEKLYLAILSRFPTDRDVRAAEEYARAGATKGRDVWVDLAWALINSPEFLLRH